MKIKYIIIFILLALVFIMSFIILSNKHHKSTTKDINKINQKQEEGDNIKLNMTVNHTAYTVVLEDNETARELVRMFPLTLEMNELNGNEKYYYFDTSFSTNEENIGMIQNGDLMIYGNNCLVLFYDSFSTTYRYTRVGYVENAENLASILGNSAITITLEQKK